MKLSESWLREWVNPTLTREELGEALTMAGLEVEEIAPVAGAFKGIVVGQILRIQKHPQADRLNVCLVDVGSGEPLSIVCGAQNVRVGMRIPVAMLDAVLPNKTVIKLTSLRGVPSHGMLCSAVELGLAEESQGLLELPPDAPLGKDLRKYLLLDDHTIDISITPNRGDCLSVKGIAREVSALTKAKLNEKPIPDVIETIKDSLSIRVSDTNGCPFYVGRIIRNLNTDAKTPVEIKQRLMRSGIRSISPVVDVTNYVMLELGQPMHAFDLNTINKEINVRTSKRGEKISLLDGSEKELDDKTLVIADQDKPLAIAGVMGGLDSSVTLLTKDILLESAYFDASVIARQRQYYLLNSDSAYRFERGVDFTIQKQAIELATKLILDIAGGEAGPVINADITYSMEQLSKIRKGQTVTLIPEKIEQVLGISISTEEVEDIFKALKFPCKHDGDQWIVKVPPYRFDISYPEDLIEEIARVYGYNKIPAQPMKAVLEVNPAIENSRDLSSLRQTFRNLSYHEVITYSFIDKKTQSLLDPEQPTKELMNPITAEMTTMRTNLWPGLINTLLYNKSRQQHRIRLFEIGTCFLLNNDELLQEPKLGGVIIGSLAPEQWGSATKEVDFYDMKGDVENVLSQFYELEKLDFKPGTHPALHPGQSANIYYQDQLVGKFGALHPTVVQALDLPKKVYVFELDLKMLKKPEKSHFEEFSKFPEIRRDIAILVNQTIPVKQIQDTIKEVAGDWLKDVFIFDVYQGKGISPEQKSIALALVLQHPTRTLVDEEVAELMERVFVALKGQLGAELRR